MLQGSNFRRDRQAVSLILGQETNPPFPARRMATGYETPPGGPSTWVDLTKEAVSGGPGGSATVEPVPYSPGRATPVAMATDQDYVRMLKEAQREFSARSSARVSPINSAMMSVSSTCKNTPSSSPKSPPNSPNVELCDFKEFKDQLRLQGVFINREPEPRTAETSPTDWGSRPNMMPPRAWLPGTKKHSGGDAAARKKELDRKLFLTLVASNVLSLGLGVAVGYWLYRRSASADILLLTD